MGAGGSPPHARGRPGAVAGDFPVGGITPACAGKTPVQSPVLSNNWDHPRMRGEDLRLRIRSLVIRGSPPHARGRLGVKVDAGRICWITPACAGKTGGLSGPFNLCKDHPRMRGEDELWIATMRGRGGSPPHARGRLVRSPDPNLPDRITPACAGKTASEAASLHGWLDHPRMRGED